MPLIAHLSDLHFGRDDTRVMNGLFESLTTATPDLVIISGDLTQRARTDEFEAAKTFLDSFAWPWLAVPGNHDLPTFQLLERFVSPWQRWSHYMDCDEQFQHHQPTMSVVGLNTARRLSSLKDWSRGSINTQQLDYVDQAIEQSNDPSLKILVAHHPFWLPMSQQRRHLIHGRDKALPRLEASGIDLILSGHVHMAFAKICQGIIISHAGTSMSDRLLPDIQNSYNLIDGDHEQLTITEMTWNGSHFHNTRKQRYASGADGWSPAS